MHYAVTHRDQPVFLTVPLQELNEKGECAVMAGPCGFGPIMRSNFLAGRVLCSKPGRSIECFDLATKFEVDLICMLGKDGEFNTGGTGIKDQDCVVHCAIHLSGVAHCLTRIVMMRFGYEHCHRTGCQATDHRISAARQNDWNSCTEHNASGVGIREER